MTDISLNVQLAEIRAAIRYVMVHMPPDKVADPVWFGHYVNMTKFLGT